MVNTWFLAGTVPALVGTEYGHPLLSKISLFFAMLVVASVLRQMLERGALVLVLYEPPAPVARLEELAAGQPGLTTAGLRVVAVKLGDGSDGDEAAPAVVVHVSRKVDKSLALFRVPGSSESELMLDRSGNVRLRWTASNLAPPDRLVAEAERVGRAPLPRRAMPVTSTN